MSEEESSVLFSLKELMTIEEDRINQEDAERKRVAEDAERARLEAERRARDAEEARRRAEEQRRLQEEQQRREEGARLEAIRHAEIERSRLEQEQKARLEEMSQQQSHALQIAALHQDKSKQRLRNWLIAIASVLVVGGGVTGVLWWRNAQANEARIAAEQREAERLRQEAERKQKELEAKLAQIEELQEKIRSAADPAEVERLKKQLDAAQTDATKLRPGGYRPTGKPGDPTSSPKKTCQPGDPLCSDI
jgi:colicin import membrane protein